MISFATVIPLLAGALLAVAPLSAPDVAEAAVTVPTANQAVITVKVGGDRQSDGSVSGLAGVKLSLFAGTASTATVVISGGVIVTDTATQGSLDARYDPTWSWTTCLSDAAGDCNFVIPIRSGPISATGVPADSRFWVAQDAGDASPTGYYSNPQLRVGSFGAAPEGTWEYRFRTDTELRAGMTYTSQTPLPSGLVTAPNYQTWRDPDRGFMRNREGGNNEGYYGSNVTRTTGIWSQSRTNPDLPETCGLRVAMVVDTSGSLGITGIAEAKLTIGKFVDAFQGTPTTMSLFSFSTASPGAAATNAPTPLPVTTAAQGTAFKAQYATWAAGGGTNWDRGLFEAANSGYAYDLVVMLTDGNPTVMGNSPSAYASTYNKLQDVDAGIFSANQLKAKGTRIVAVGVGTAVTLASDVNLRAVSGTTKSSDYYNVLSFADAATALAGIATANCQGSIQVQKKIVPLGGTIAQATDAPAGWQFDATSLEAAKVTVNAPATATTTADSHGMVNFGLAYTSPATTGLVKVQETQQAGYALLPDSLGKNAVCVNAATGASVAVTNVTDAAKPGFSIDTVAKAQITCTIYNTPLKLTVEKISNPATGTAVAPGSTVTYTLKFTNTGSAPVPVDYTDSLNNVLDDATWQGAAVVTPAGGLTVVRATTPINKLTITGSVLAKSTVTVSYTVVVKSGTTGDAVLKNVLAPTTTTPPTDCVPTDPTVLCTTHPITGSYSMKKVSVPATGAIVSPGDVITYTVTATGKDAPVTGVIITDTLTDVLDDATFVSGAAKLTVGTGAATNVADPTGTPVILHTAPFTLAQGTTATLTYQVKVNADAWSRTLRNVVTGTSDGNVPPATCDPCTTTQTTPGKLLIEKIGESSTAVWVPMDGSAWAVFNDNAGQKGTLYTRTGVTAVVPSATGQFQLVGIPSGTYWLAETKAPAGFSLLAEPVQFTLAANGVVTLGPGAGGGVVTVADTDGDKIFLITVRDVPALMMPESGGSGTIPYLAGGILLLGLAGTLWYLNQRRRRRSSGDASS
ncbi:hypothetical protein GCM10022381_39410 [Leifsonia kafniensis]|uniref:VWFA domain-containing protein n=2 Tax=Leifsonia kafniensis TaxID=475957 RepID=A0ABP7L7B3_9MICO